MSSTKALRFRGGLLAVVLALSSSIATHSATSPTAAQPGQTSSTVATARAAFGDLPMSFEANQGQTDRDVRFLARGQGYAVYLTPAESVLQLRQPRQQTFGRDARRNHSTNAAASTDVLRMKLANANRRARIDGENRLPGNANYFKGGAPAHVNVPTYAKVRYHEVYRGVDLVYYGNQGQLEYDFLVSPQGEPSRIRLTLDGARDVTLDDRGNLVVQLEGRQVTWQAPVSYQEIRGARQHVESRYALHQDHETFAIGFEVGRYDRTRPLVIDPVLAYSTYLGGSDQDSGFGITVDKAGHAYVTGDTNSLDFPTSRHAFQSTFAGGPEDVFVTKLSAKGQKVLYSTYIGGSDDDYVLGIALKDDDDGPKVYLTGTTNSTDYPTTRRAYQSTIAGGYDVFVTKLSPQGNRLEYSTYLGGSGDEDFGTGAIAVNSAGQAFVTGSTNSPDFPTTPGVVQPILNGASNAYVTKLDHQGRSLVYSTYLGGESSDDGTGIALDDAGNAYVSGGTSSASFPTTPGAFQTTYQGNEDAFATKLNPRGTAFVYSTYLGGTDFDFATGIALDEKGNAHVAGATSSTADFPTTIGAFQTTTGGPAHGMGDGFVTKFNKTGTGLVYSTLLGGTDYDQAQGVDVDRDGNAYLAGITFSTDFPTEDAFQPAIGGDLDATVTKLNKTGTALVYSSYLGGAGADAPQGNAIVVDRDEAAYVVGVTYSLDFPTTPEAFQPVTQGVSDAFVVKVNGSKKSHHHDDDDD